MCPRPRRRRGRSNILCVYAVVFYPGNAVPEFEVLYKDQIEEFRARSPAKDAGPWVSDYAEMAEVRALNRLAKRMPIGAKLGQLFEGDDEQDELEYVADTQGTILEHTSAAPAPAAIEAPKEQPMASPVPQEAQPEPVPRMQEQAPPPAVFEQARVQRRRRPPPDTGPGSLELGEVKF